MAQIDQTINSRFLGGLKGKMKNYRTKATKWEALFMILMTTPITGHVLFLPFLLEEAGRDLWISALISVPMGLVVVGLIAVIRKNALVALNTDSTNILQYGGVLRYFSLIIVLYLLSSAAISTASLLEMVKTAFMPETPLWALGIWFLIIYLYGARKGIVNIIWTSVVLAFVGLVTGHTITLILLHMKDWNNLLPMLQHGWVPPIKGALLITSMWAEFSILLFIPLQSEHRSHLFSTWSVGVLLDILMIISTGTGAVTIFGLELARNFTYPALESVRLMSLGFIDRFDIYGMILMLFGCYSKVALYISFTGEFFLSLVRTKKKAISNIPLYGAGALVFSASYLIAVNYWRMLEGLRVYIYFGVFVTGMLVLFYLLSLRERAKYIDKTVVTE